MLIPKMYRPRRASGVIETVRQPARAGRPTGRDAVREPRPGHHRPDPGRTRECGFAGRRVPPGHMNRLNDHWQALQEGGQSWSSSRARTPTSPRSRTSSGRGADLELHHRAPARPGRAQSPGEPTFDVITPTVRELEKVAGTAWDMTDSLDYFRRIQPAVGAFRVHVESAEAMFKLSQEHPAEVRRSIRDHLSLTAVLGVDGCPRPCGRRRPRPALVRRGGGRRRDTEHRPANLRTRWAASSAPSTAWTRR